MNGAEALLRTAADCGIDVCFANPGTTELHLVEALDRVREIRPVLGLFEGVCTGAADGYARLAGRPALTLTHLGPGFANALACAHNARRAHTPMVNLIGDHATWHRAVDAPLQSDIESLARPMSVWVRTSARAGDVAGDLVDAVVAARTPPGGPATLIVPNDCAWDDVTGGPAAAPNDWPAPGLVGAEQVADVADQLRRAGDRAVILVGSGGLSAEGKRSVARVAAATGAAVLASAPGGLHDRGRHLPAFRQLPYFPDQARPALAGAEVVVLAGAREPVTFFGYPGEPSRVAPPEATVVTLATPADDVAAALRALSEALGAEADDPLTAARFAPPDPPQRAASGSLDPGSLGRTVAALLPEGAVLVIEAVTAAWGLEAAANGAVPHTALLATAGGAIGQGLPAAVGAAVARPTSKIVALQADGSAAYTVQSLWTMAREGLDVVVVLCSNRRYAILQVELGRAGVVEPGPASAGLTALDRPAISWVGLAEGFGVPASAADDAASFGAALERALATPGPHLIEARL